MAINPSSEFPGRIIAPDANYTYGSSKNETSPGAGDGTPYVIARANDIFGFQQALLKLAAIVPSGNAETQLVSQYLQAIVELAAGRAVNYDESGVADTYVLDLQTNQQGPKAYFDGMLSKFTPGNNNTGASTVNVIGLGVKNIFFNGVALRGGELLTTRKATIEHDLANDRVNLILKQDGDYVAVESASGRAYNYDESGAINVYVLDVQSGQVGPKTYFDGMRSDFFPSADNTGASTANVAGLGVKNIFFNGSALTGGELTTTVKASIEYDLVNDRVNLQPSISTGGTAGSVVQVVNVVDSAFLISTASIPYDDTIPQIGEGVERMTLGITPKNIANLLKIEVTINVNGAEAIIVGLFKDAIANAKAAVVVDSGGLPNLPVTLTFWEAAGSVSATTYRVRCGSESGFSVNYNGAAGSRRMGGIMASTITITEYKV